MYLSVNCPHFMYSIIEKRSSGGSDCRKTPGPLWSTDNGGRLSLV